MDAKSQDSKTLVVRNDLDLSSVNSPEVPKDVFCPEEVNTYLRHQLHRQKSDKEILGKQLEEKDVNLRDKQKKIEELSNKIREYEYGETVLSLKFASSKIQELSKKLRDKTSEVEAYKSRCTKLERNLSEVKEKNESIASKSPQVQDNTPEKTEPNELKKLQDKLLHTANKLFEVKNSNMQLKRDLQIANKWLEQEVGDNFETLLANMGVSHWRGRAQVICDLQQKNVELKEKLKEFQERDQHGGQTKSDESKKIIELLKKETIELQTGLEEMKKKLDIAKIRCKVAESDCTVVKAKLAASKEALERSKQKITELSSQISQQHGVKVNESTQREQLKIVQRENDRLKVELAKELCNVENKSKEVEDKEKEIAMLRKKIRGSRPTSSYMHRPSSSSVGNTTVAQDTKVIGQLEVERLKLLELMEIENKRLEEERNAHSKTQTLLKYERQKGAKLEANLARMELEKNSRVSYASKSNNRTTAQNDFNFKDQLELAEEKIKALTARLDMQAYERKRDLQEFSSILRNYNYN